MPTLQRKEVPTVTAEEYKEQLQEREEMEEPLNVPIDTSIVVSTGCTLLDLAISGGRVKGGGMPGGIMVEIFGGSGSGKTALLMELAASVQAKGGETRICDPEARLDKEYARIYGAEIKKDNYFRPTTVGNYVNSTGKITEYGLEGLILDWNPKNEEVINLLGADSIAALSTTMEMESGDKRGQRKAKELSELCRKTAVLIAQQHKLVVFINQIRDGEYGVTTPGGHAVPFHSSLRIQCIQKGKIEKKKKNEAGVEVKKIIGIESELFIKKSSIDDPYRAVPMYLMFGMGIDDVRGNLQYIKDMNKETVYDAIDKSFQRLDSAIAYIEDNNLESELRKMVIEVWESNEALFKQNRKTKRRF